MNARELLDRYEARGLEEDFENAKRQYEAALEGAPQDAQLLNDYGYLLECHGRRALAAAAEAYRRAIQADPDWAKPRFQLISTAAALGQPEDAIEAYRARVAAAGDDVSAHRLLASAYLVAHRFELAEEAARAGLDVAPEDGQLLNELGEALAGEGRSEDALDAWRRGYRADPESLEGRYGSAFVLEREGRIGEAIAEWRFIASWSKARGNDLDAEWPEREIARLEAG